MLWVIMRSLMLLAGIFAAKSALAAPCERKTFDGADYIICTVDPRGELRLFWKDARGEPFKTFSNLASAVARDGHKLVFALNAGMYSESFAPVGLYTENGKEMLPVNIDNPPETKRPVPNFYKKPNGVFFIAGSSAHIVTTDDYLASKPDAQFATQSGPMLVIRNTLHQALIPGSTDRTHRSGVGICENKAIRFAISEDEVNFHDFATLFRDRLGCPDALFLDGGRGVGLFDAAMGRSDISGHGGYGPIFGFVE